MSFRAIWMLCLLAAGLGVVHAATRAEVVAWINRQAHTRVTDPSRLRYVAVNLDDDPALEIAAHLPAAVHAGMFYLLDPQGPRYRLIVERPWHVIGWSFTNPIVIGSTHLFEVVERTGDPGLDQRVVHLWFLHRGVFTESWTGLVAETAKPLPDIIRLTLGGYQVDAETRLLSTWKTVVNLDPATKHPLPETEQTVTLLYGFDGARFTIAQTDPVAVAQSFAFVRLRGNSRALAGFRIPVPPPGAEESTVLWGPANPHPLSVYVGHATPSGGRVQVPITWLDGNAGTVIQARDETVTLEHDAKGWRVVGIASGTTAPVAPLTVTNSDPTSLAALRLFLDARVHRKLPDLRRLIAPDFPTTRLPSLIGAANPRYIAYDITAAVRATDTVSYRLQLILADEALGILGTTPETITLRQVDGAWRVNAVQEAR